MEDCGGECVACQRLVSCSEASVERVLTSYVCPLFKPVSEAEYLARWDMMKRFGNRVAIRALVLAQPTREEER